MCVFLCACVCVCMCMFKCGHLFIYKPARAQQYEHPMPDSETDSGNCRSTDGICRSCYLRPTSSHPNLGARCWITTAKLDDVSASSCKSR